MVSIQNTKYKIISYLIYFHGSLAKQKNYKVNCRSTVSSAGETDFYFLPEYKGRKNLWLS